MVYRLFISHRWRYDGHDRLVSLLNNGGSDFRWEDWSVDRERGYGECSPRAMRQALRARMAPVHAVLVVAGMEAHYSEWMQTELAIAASDFDKPLVWVRPRGLSRIPDFAYDVADEIVGWTHASVVTGIERAVARRRPDFLRRSRRSRLG
jgi:hypothetical protein